jgi:hypothetical protein
MLIQSNPASIAHRQSSYIPFCTSILLPESERDKEF